MVRVAIVIVSYNTVGLLRQALASVARTANVASGSLAVRTIVVDNGSTDGSAEMVTAEFPDVILIAAGQNLGFTAANNLALAKLGLVMRKMASGTGAVAHVEANDSPDYVLLLNPDAELTDGALERLVEFMEARPEVGMAGPRLLYGDGTFQHGAFTFPDVAQVVLDLFPVGRLPGAHRLYAGALNGRYPRASWQGNQPFAVDFILGAAFFVRAEVVREIGGLDEGYFMYCEEMDWALRAQQAGWQVYAVPDATAIHHEAQSSKQIRWRSWRRLWESRLRFYTLHRSHFAPGTLGIVKTLLWLANRWQIFAARSRFGQGKRTGIEAAEEIAARTALLAEL